MGELRFRAATADDAAFAADVYTAVRPIAPVDPVLLRFDWERPPDNWVADRALVELDGDAIGFATADHPRWDRAPRPFGVVGGELLPAHRHARTLDAVFAEVERRLAAAGARELTVRANEDDPTRVDAILGRGYREDRRGCRWELDLVANRERILTMAAASRERMAEQGVRLLTVAEDADAEKYRKIWRLSAEADLDVPTTLGHVEETLDDYLRWFEAPDVRADRFWLAREGDEIVGVSVLSYPPVRGVVGTAWTATSRRARGRGIARAVKCETLVQALALGVDRVRTGNDAANDPILHINATMGYRPIAGAINFLKNA